MFDVTGEWGEWHFSANPFAINPLPPEELGVKLLVGRDAELRQIRRRLSTPPKCVTVEGPNGIGKTSMVNVAAYQAFLEFCERKSEILLLPCTKTFQLEPRITTDDFVDDVYFEVARTLISYKEKLKSHKDQLRGVAAVERWLSDPFIDNLSGGLSLGVPFFSIGLSGGKQGQPNTSAGFSRSGFQAQIRQWLSSCFGRESKGGIVCVLDNLELLQTSKEARERMEELRDRLLTVSGLRWVLCGAAGIVNSVVSTARLSGVLWEPVEVGGLPPGIAPQVWDTRIDAYGRKEQGPLYMPLRREDFERLFSIFRGNLRSALSEADNYCMTIADKQPAQRPSTPEEMGRAFAGWLDQRCRKLLLDINGQLTEKAWEVFRRAVSQERPFSPNEYADFQCNSREALREPVKQLEDVGLLKSSIDENDRRRKTIEVTENGWLVAHAKRYGADPE